MARIVDLGITKVSWVTTISSLTAPTAAELAAGKDITCDLTTSYEFRADASNTVTELGVCDTSEAVTPTTGKYIGNLVIFRNFSTGGVADADDLLATFAGNYEAGHLARRLGLPQTTAFAASQVIDLGSFIADVPQIQGGTGAGFLKMTVPLLAQGFYSPKVTVAGA